MTLPSPPLDREKDLIFIHNSAPICKTFGMTLDYGPDGGALIRLPHNPRIDHGFGGIHGGVIATLLDNAGWFTVAQYFSEWVATVEFQVRLLEHVESQELRAAGKIVKLGKRISFAEMEIYSGEGKKIAVGSGVFTATRISLRAEEVKTVLKKYDPLFL